MAPKKGGSSSSSSGSSSINTSCPGAFTGTYSSTQLANFVLTVLMIVFVFALLIGAFKVRKRHPHAKKLAGPVYLISLACWLIGGILAMIAVLLQECNTTPVRSYYYWAIVFGILYKISTFLLLFIVVYQINNYLRQRLAMDQGMYRMLTLMVSLFMCVLTVVHIGMSSYTFWRNSPAGRGSYDFTFMEHYIRFSMAYYALYLISAVGSGALALVTTSQLKRRGYSVGDFFLWIIVITSFMFLWTLLVCIDVGESLNDNLNLSTESRMTFNIVVGYLESFFQLFAYIAVLFLAKSNAWNQTNNDPADPQNYKTTAYTQYAPLTQNQQQYAYMAVPGQQGQHLGYYSNQQTQPQQLQQPQFQQQPVHDVPELVAEKR